MLKNYKEAGDSRLNFTEKDYVLIMQQNELSRVEVEDIVNIFHQKGGVLNRHQFKQYFEELTKKWLNHKNPTEIADWLFRSFDKNNDAVLEMHEFMLGCGYIFLCKGDRRKIAEYLFNFYDAQQDGVITMNDLRRTYETLFRMLGTENVDDVAKTMAEETMKEISMNGEKKVSKSDFVNLLLNDDRLFDRFRMFFQC